MAGHCCRKAAVPGDQGQRTGISALAGRLLTVLFRGYQYFVSPLFPATCRYTPTCSQYAIEAVARYGAIRGLFMAVRRILRCHPFARGGFDPVK